MSSIVQFLMDEDEVQDALTEYRTDPTDENKRRVIEAILNEAQDAQADLASCAVALEPTHRYVLIPNITTIHKKKVSHVRDRIEMRNLIDSDYKSIAALARRAADRVHSLGGSAVYVRFEPDEWSALFENEGHIRTLTLFDNIQERTDLDQIADELNTFIARLGNVDSPEYAAKLIRKMYAVACGQIDESIGQAIIRMVDTTGTKNVPSSICKEPEDANEEE